MEYKYQNYNVASEYFKKMAMANSEVPVLPSEKWSDDKWTKNQEKRKFIHNNGWWRLSDGRVVGKVVGGNLCSLNLLQGTKYMPIIGEKILFIEDDSMSTAGEFSRNLRSLMCIDGAKEIIGLVLGRFQKKTEMSRKKLELIVAQIPELDGKPVLANVDFGHTDPKISWCVGGEADLEVEDCGAKLILK